MKQQTSHNTKSKLLLSASTVTSTPSPSSRSCPARLGLRQGASHASTRHLALGERRGSSLPVIRPATEAARLFHQPGRGNICTSRRQKTDQSLGLGEPRPSFLNPLLGAIRRKQCCDQQAGQGTALPSPISILSRWML